MSIVFCDICGSRLRSYEEDAEGTKFGICAKGHKTRLPENYKPMIWRQKRDTSHD